MAGIARVAPKSVRSSGPSVQRDSNDLLVAQQIFVSFEGVRALQGIDLSLRRKDILGLIGPNGAGKTTLVNVLTGFQRPDSGQINLSGRDATRWPAHRIARAGVARTFQAGRLFRELPVIENLEAAAAATGLGRRAARDLAWDILAWLRLTDQADRRAGTLPHGDERRIGIARALALRPTFVLLDEPAAGLNEPECDDLMETIARMPKDFGCGLLLIEHNMRVIMGVCERLQVLDGGRTVAEGPLSDVRTDPKVIRAYLGTDRRHAALRQ